jgi:serine/threonine protein kinase
MAAVYKARHTGTDKLCALKLVHPHLVKDERVVKLFVKEAKVGTKIGSHPNIVNMFDAGVDDATGRPFIAMDLLEGETLESALERGPLNHEQARALFEQLASALSQAHAAGVIHRDLKPSNLFLVKNLQHAIQLQVLDFGIAKALEAEVRKTATQVGTPAYAAPEQMGPTARRLAAKQGLTVAKEVSAATDVWALALIAYEALTGQPSGQYWGVDTPAELPLRVVLEELEPASARAGAGAQQLPPGFDEWFARCLAKDASKRPPEVRTAVTQLLELLDDSAEHTESASSSAPAPVSNRRTTEPMLPEPTPIASTVVQTPVGAEDGDEPWEDEPWVDEPWEDEPWELPPLAARATEQVAQHPAKSTQVAHNITEVIKSKETPKIAPAPVRAFAGGSNTSVATQILVLALVLAALFAWWEAT